MDISYSDNRDMHEKMIMLGHGTGRLAGYGRLGFEVDTDLAFHIEVIIAPSELQLLWDHHQKKLAADRERAKQREALQLQAKTLPKRWHFPPVKEVDRSLKTIPFPTRLLRIFERKGIGTLGQLMSYNTEDLRHFGGFGTMCEVELIASLKEVGIDIIVDEAADV